MELNTSILEKKKFRAYLEILGTSLAWALSAVLLKMYIEQVPPYHLLTGRFVIATIFIFAMRPNTVKAINKENLKVGIPLGFFIFLAYASGIVCLKYTTASKSSFLVSLSVLFVPLIESFMRRKLPSKWIFVSVIISILGLRLISGMDGTGYNIGDTLAILSSVFYSIYIVLMDRTGKDIEEMILTLIQLGVVSICGTIVLLFYEGLNFQYFKIILIPIFVIGILCTGMSTLFQTRAQKVASSESVGILLLGEPLFTTILAFIVLKETILISGFIGGILILLSLVIAIIKKV